MKTQMKKIWLVTLSIALFAASALATDVTVGCPGGQRGDFSSITAALNSLDQFGPHIITVTGTCTESLFIADRDGVTIIAPDGQTATVNAASSTDIVILFVRAHRMVLDGLVIQGGSTGVQLALASDAVIQNCVIQNNSSDGILTQSNATLDVENSTSQKNGGSGLTAAADSNVTLGTFPSQRIHFNDNGFAGINVDGSYLQVNFGVVTIENNGWSAILANGGRLLMFGDNPQGTGSVIQNNGDGIGLYNATSATFYGQHLVKNNGAAGLQVQGSSVYLFGGALPDGTPDGMVIEDHSMLGVNVTSSADVILNGSHKIRSNGSAGGDPDFLSGLRVSRASVTVTGGTQIRNNTGPGILSDFNSNIQFGPDLTIAGNTDGGVRLLHMSVGNVLGPFHSNQSITCDETSLLFGDLAGVASHCTHAERVPSSAGLPKGLKR
jgi:hypothetical protein